MLQQPKKINKRARIREYLESIYYLDLPKKGRASQQFISEYLGISVGMVNLVINEMKKEKLRTEKLKNSKKKEKDSIPEKTTPIARSIKPTKTTDIYVKALEERLAALEKRVRQPLKTIPSLSQFEEWLKEHSHKKEALSLYKRISGDGTKHGERKAAAEVRKTLDLLRDFFNE